MTGAGQDDLTDAARAVIHPPQVTVSAVIRGRRTQLHTFFRYDLPDRGPVWFEHPEPSHGQRTDYRAAIAAFTDAQRGQVSEALQRGGGPTPPPARRPQASPWRLITAAGTDRVTLRPGLDPEGRTFWVILEALHAAGKATVCCGDLAAVLSQLGNRIAGLDALPPHHRRHAEDALTAEIVGRCTTL